jgi:hypothetical protein
MSGGIIIQRRAVLVPAATDPSIYDSLSHNNQGKVDEIAAKAPGDTTEEDIQTLGAVIHVATHC